MTGHALNRRVAALEQADAGAKPWTMIYVGFGETLEQAMAPQFGPAGAPPDASLIIVTLGEA
ncbi:hypothetical protein [Belnapia rosea]|uniref:Uncharacterized protein n=1 Tax=Belnapia rosea TaxID=938405 RepID=A0A1G6YUX5_9PROT|nr:hypothetical protein [Belnapia rosea]SDD94082.1 hypothetical protein SAMN04487779_101514 [Belnapia rosea]